MHKVKQRFSVQWNLCDWPTEKNLDRGLFDSEDVCYYTNEETYLCGESPIAKNFNNMMAKAKSHVRNYFPRKLISDNFKYDGWNWEEGWEVIHQSNNRGHSCTWLRSGTSRMYRLTLEWRMLNERE